MRFWLAVVAGALSLAGCGIKSGPRAPRAEARAQIVVPVATSTVVVTSSVVPDGAAR